MFLIFTYKTVQEKAAEWDVSIRYVQGLCRKGKVEGAIKRGGVWFVPAMAICPSTSNDQIYQYTGTKKKLFEKAIELFADKSYETVTIKDIADEVGVAGSAFYNHFKSKQEILDNIYGYFRHYYKLDRPSIDELEPVLKNGSLMEILESVNYTFNEKYANTIIGTMKIVMQRMFIEDRAKKLYREVILESGVNYAQRVFQKAQEMGRFPPDVDTRALSIQCNMNQHFYLLAWISNSNLLQNNKLKESQDAMYQMIIQSIRK